MTSTLESALAARLAASPAAPLITAYDETTGERTELSGTTSENWLAKTANLLRDGVGVQPGDVVAIDLPLHWLLPVWLGACAMVGAVAAPGGDAADAVLAVCGPDGIEAALRAPDVMAVSLAPMAMPFRTPLPAGVDDYCLEVRSYGDRFAPGPRVAPTSTTWVLAGEELSHSDVLARADALVDRIALARGGRLLTTRPPVDLDGVLAVLAAPVRVSGSVVLVTGADVDRVVALAAAENADVVLR